MRGAVVAERVGERHRLLGGVVGQAQHDEVDVGQHRLAGGRVLALAPGSMLFTSTPGSRASRSRISRPVVPASPSMKILAFDVLMAQLSSQPQLRLCGIGCRTRCCQYRACGPARGIAAKLCPIGARCPATASPSSRS